MSQPFLSEPEVRAVVRILGEVAASRDDHAAKKRQLMDGLCQIVGADFWVWALGAAVEPGQPPIYTSMLTGGFEPAQFGRLLKALEHPDMAAMTEPFARLLAQKRCHLTRSRQQIVPVGVIESLPVWQLWNEADIGPILLSFRPLHDGGLSCIALYRRTTGQLFSERESRIAHIVLSEVPWLHLQGWPDDRGATVPQLTPRQRIVLNLLVSGRSRKGIAAQLGISEHTANDHVKAVFRHFHVNSQTQLASRFLQGDGGDCI